MGYPVIERRLQGGGIVVLDGGTGTELERRGVTMDPKAWCGPSSLENSALLQSIHEDYIAAGADIITVNTYASSRLMLEPAGFAGQFKEINCTAITAALRAREASGQSDVLIAGSLSHMCPIAGGTSKPVLNKVPSQAQMADAFAELATLFVDQGCDLILLEMMYYPERMGLAFEAAKQTGLPVWAGFSVRRGDKGQVLSYAPDRDIPFEDVVEVLKGFDVEAAGVMHSPSDITADAIEIVRGVYSGPLTAYPDSGYFEMPHWQFKDVITPDALLQFASKWVENGVQVIGGCCGLSPEHIAALRILKGQQT
ncbi:MAG: homocysteine S-methyltransferase family protein [Rhodospirillaceae bacterium]|nr:homocysteine S-methyltransferase family protein [Rhodospirillaceae bacterium]MBL6941280.1 homocysteine S-methyltransferase family protein [Rhodospirillales bacterium]